MFADEVATVRDLSSTSSLPVISPESFENVNLGLPAFPNPKVMLLVLQYVPINERTDCV
jgi:hypothetical protein